MVGGLQELVGPMEQGQPRIAWRVRCTARITRLKFGVAVLAHNLSAQVLDPYLQIATAGRAFLNKERGM
jgi:hypothetical protein